LELNFINSLFCVCMSTVPFNNVQYNPDYPSPD
jgi:hypothetical protein